jgi:hypothetical protein
MWGKGKIPSSASNSSAASMAKLGVASRDGATTLDGAITAGGMISGERSMWDANIERGTLELRHKEILARIDILNQLNTQSMLIAGCAVQALGGESLQVVEVEATDTPWESALGGILATLFVGSTAVTLTTSLWVIFTSTHLIELSQHTALHGTRAQDVTEANYILEDRMRDVRMFYIVALASLLLSSLLMVCMSMSGRNAAVVAVVIVWVTVHAVQTRVQAPAPAQPRPAAVAPCRFRLRAPQPAAVLPESSAAAGRRDRTSPRAPLCGTPTT